MIDYEDLLKRFVRVVCDKEGVGPDYFFDYYESDDHITDEEKELIFKMDEDRYD